MASTTTIPTVIGMVSASAPAPARTSTRMISSVAYAEDEMLSDAKIERPVKTFRRSTELLVDRDRAAEQNGSDSRERSAHRRSRDGRRLAWQ